MNEAERRLGLSILAAAEAALARGGPEITDFLDPSERRLAEGIVARCPGLGSLSNGGYAGAERRRMALFPDFVLTELIEWPLVGIWITGPFEGAPPREDLLRAALATGVGQRKVGDVWWGADAGQLVVAAEVAETLIARLDRVGPTHVQAIAVELERLSPPTQREREITGTVASLRLDAVASLGFSVSRSRMLREIHGEKLSINWRTVSDPARAVRAGDVIAWRGGRVVVAAVGGTTRKGRTGIVLKRFQ